MCVSIIYNVVNIVTLLLCRYYIVHLLLLLNVVLCVVLLVLLICVHFIYLLFTLLLFIYCAIFIDVLHLLIICPVLLLLLWYLLFAVHLIHLFVCCWYWYDVDICWWWHLLHLLLPLMFIIGIILIFDIVCYCYCIIIIAIIIVCVYCTLFIIYYLCIVLLLCVIVDICIHCVCICVIYFITLYCYCVLILLFVLLQWLVQYCVYCVHCYCYYLLQYLLNVIVLLVRIVVCVDINLMIFDICVILHYCCYLFCDTMTIVFWYLFIYCVVLLLLLLFVCYCDIVLILPHYCYCYWYFVLLFCVVTHINYCYLFAVVDVVVGRSVRCLLRVVTLIVACVTLLLRDSRCLIVDAAMLMLLPSCCCCWGWFTRCYWCYTLLMLLFVTGDCRYFILLRCCVVLHILFTFTHLHFMLYIYIYTFTLFYCLIFYTHILFYVFILLTFYILFDVCISFFILFWHLFLHFGTFNFALCTFLRCYFWTHISHAFDCLYTICYFPTCCCIVCCLPRYTLLLLLLHLLHFLHFTLHFTPHLLLRVLFVTHTRMPRLLLPLMLRWKMHLMRTLFVTALLHLLVTVLLHTFVVVTFDVVTRSRLMLHLPFYYLFCLRCLVAIRCCTLLLPHVVRNVTVAGPRYVCWFHLLIVDPLPAHRATTHYHVTDWLFYVAQSLLDVLPFILRYVLFGCRYVRYILFCAPRCVVDYRLLRCVATLRWVRLRLFALLVVFVRFACVTLILRYVWITLVDCVSVVYYSVDFALPFCSVEPAISFVTALPLRIASDKQWCRCSFFRYHTVADFTSAFTFYGVLLRWLRILLLPPFCAAFCSVCALPFYLRCRCLWF